VLLESFQAALNAGKSFGRIKLLLNVITGKIIFGEFWRDTFCTWRNIY